jgi:hypothetical protein
VAIRAAEAAAVQTLRRFASGHGVGGWKWEDFETNYLPNLSKTIETLLANLYPGAKRVEAVGSLQRVLNRMPHSPRNWKSKQFPKGLEALPEPPEHTTVTTVKGNKPGAGIYYHDDTVTPAEIRKAVWRGRLPEFLREANTSVPLK